ncbi:hypothetical protein [Aureispira anguillae]|uniref:Polyketide cyclase / dehydrase and lipid transport n=1 Tax=Aureispira anguillae TaxID=2864201 RepID=A0A916DS16_9BACT|nr:hypothetical protein [Aureispira anguillae]BDS10526.1 hypothetical protein AsAng_0012340 [Aureispira anguillae]
MKKKITRTTGYKLSIEVEQQALEAFNFFCDLDNHVHLHPLLTKVTEVDSFYNDKGKEVTVFEIEERVKILGLISMPNKYIAHRILQKEQNTCVFEVKSFPNICLSSSYTFLENGGNKTEIQEHVKIQAPLGLSNFVTKTAKNAHHTLLEQLKEYLEQETIEV